MSLYNPPHYLQAHTENLSNLVGVVCKTTNRIKSISHPRYHFWTISENMTFFAGALVFNDTLWPQVNTSSLRNVDLLKLEKYIGTATNTNISTQHNNKNGTLGQLYTLKTKNGTGLLSPVTLLYNTTSDHSLPALVQEVAQARFRARINNSSATLRISSHPLPLTKNEALRVQTILTALAALFTLIPFSYCAASFAVFVVQERVVKAKLLQVVVVLPNSTVSKLPCIKNVIFNTVFVVIVG